MVKVNHFQRRGSGVMCSWAHKYFMLNLKRSASSWQSFWKSFKHFSRLIECTAWSECETAICYWLQVSPQFTVCQYIELCEVVVRFENKRNKSDSYYSKSHQLTQIQAKQTKCVHFSIAWWHLYNSWNECLNTYRFLRHWCRCKVHSPFVMNKVYIFNGHGHKLSLACSNSGWPT